MSGLSHKPSKDMSWGAQPSLSNGMFLSMMKEHLDAGLKLGSHFHQVFTVLCLST